MDFDAIQRPCYFRGCYGLIYFAWTGIFMYFAFFNPDKGYCWSQNGMNTPRPGNEFVSGWQLVNRQYENWFAWNAILYFIAGIQCLLFTSFRIVDDFFNLGHKTYLGGRLILIVWGIVLRAGWDGRMCSGDLYTGDEVKPEPYLWVSGKFIKYNLLYQVFLEIPVMTLLHSFGRQPSRFK